MAAAGCDPWVDHGCGGHSQTEGEKRQRERGIRLWLVGMNPHVLAVVQRSQLDEALGRDAMHFNLEIAVSKYLGAGAAAGAS